MVQQAAGPVWVKPDILRKNKLPSEGKDVYIRYDNGECKDTGDAVIIEALFWKGFKDVEWLDESNTQQLFTRDQVRKAFIDGQTSENCRFSRRDYYTDSEYMDINYPETK